MSVENAQISFHKSFIISPGENQSTITFGTLLASQALSDRKALRDTGRNVIRLHLGRDVSGGLQRIVALLA